MTWRYHFRPRKVEWGEGPVDLMIPYFLGSIYHWSWSTTRALRDDMPRFYHKRAVEADEAMKWRLFVLGRDELFYRRKT